MDAMVMVGENSKVSTTTDTKPTTTTTTATQTATRTNQGGVFHDFLGRKVANLRTVSGFQPETSSPSEKPAGSQVERNSCYGPRTEQSMSEISHQFIGNKRNHLDSPLVESPGNGVLHGIPESSHVMKLLRNTSGAERPKMPPYDGILYGHQVRPSSASFMLQQSAGAFGMLKPERLNPMNVGEGSIQYNQHIGQASPVSYQIPSSRFRQDVSGPSILSQLAADEGSRTGNKGSGIFKSFDAVGGLVSERNLPGLVSSGYNVKPVTFTSEPEPSAPPSQSGVTSECRQMTIIFGGQVHVFDDVHPNKADVIMSLAGSNGASWSTMLPKYTARETTTRSCFPSRENQRSTFDDRSLPVKYDSILPASRNSNHGYGPTNASGLVIRAAETKDKSGRSRLEAKQEVE